jgi:hypothetical protein
MENVELSTPTNVTSGGEKMAKPEDSGQAVIEGDALVIRVSLANLPMVLEGAWAMGKFDTRFKITDASEFAKELMHALNREDEQGTTPVHEMFDKAILYATEQGALGIDEHETQEV